jgi:hypothetical protein
MAILIASTAAFRLEGPPDGLVKRFDAPSSIRFQPMASPALSKSSCPRRLLLAIALASLWFGSVGIAQPSTPSESQVKAAFVINFAKYVEWPASAFDRTDSPIIIAVLGKSNVAAALQQMIPGRIIDGRNLVMEQLASGAKPGRCHILFVPASEPQLSPGLVADLRNAGVLTVGESGDFLDSGGMINLALRDQRIALEVNLPAADQAGIKLSSKLLSVARVEKRRAH